MGKAQAGPWKCGSDSDFIREKSHKAGKDGSVCHSSHHRQSCTPASSQPGLILKKIWISLIAPPWELPHLWICGALKPQRSISSTPAESLPSSWCPEPPVLCLTHSERSPGQELFKSLSPGSNIPTTPSSHPQYVPAEVPFPLTQH